MKWIEFSFFTVLSILMIACGTDRKEKTIQAQQDAAMQFNFDADTVMAMKGDTGVVWKYKLFINRLPFPFRLLDESKNAGFSFVKNNLNPVNNIVKYNEKVNKAIGLGIYGTDIAYVIAHEQWNETGSYVKTAKRLAADLSIPDAIMEEGFMKYNEYRDNKDTLVRMIYESYHRVDTMLKSNEQIGLAGLVVTGCWLEGLHLSVKPLVNVNIAGKVDAKLLYQTISRQKYYLNNILNLLAEFNKEPFYMKLIGDLERIKKELDAIKAPESLSVEELNSINSTVENLRNRLIDAI